MDYLSNKVYGQMIYNVHPLDVNITTQIYYFFGIVNREPGQAWTYLCLSEIRESIRYLIVELLNIVPNSYDITVQTNLDPRFESEEVYFFTKYLYTEHGKVTICIGDKKVFAYLKIDSAVLREMPEEDMI